MDADVGQLEKKTLVTLPSSHPPSHTHTHTWLTCPEDSIHWKTPIEPERRRACRAGEIEQVLKLLSTLSEPPLGLSPSALQILKDWSEGILSMIAEDPAAARGYFAQCGTLQARAQRLGDLSSKIARIILIRCIVSQKHHFFPTPNDRLLPIIEHN